MTLRIVGTAFALWGAVLATPAYPAAAPAPDPVSLQIDLPLQQGGFALGWAPMGTTRLTLDGKAVRIADDGRFAIGLGRDAPSSAQLEATLNSGDSVRLTLPVASRSWRIENLKTLPRVAQPSAEFAARRPSELAQIEAARAKDTGSSGWRQSFRWPATGRISGQFGSQRIYAGEPGVPHNGVDVAAGTGTPVFAPADGVVILAATSPFTLEGHLLMLDHGMGLNSAFLHLSRIDVVPGQSVRQGDPIGAIGMTGRATGPHLHWSLRLGDVRLDPALVAGPMSTKPKS